MIPRTIYQTWHSKDLPRGIVAEIRRMQALNRGYEHVLYDDLDMLEFIEGNYCDDVVRAYRMLQIGAAKADFWRYLVLCRHGGIYLDIDSMITAPLDPLIEGSDGMILSRETNPGLFLQWCVISVPFSPVLRRCIEACVSNILNYRGGDVVLTTGPRVFTGAVNHVLGLGDAWSLPSVFEVVREGINHRIVGTDFHGYCSFKSPCANELYKNRPHWVAETKTKAVVERKEHRAEVQPDEWDLGAIPGSTGTWLFRNRAIAIDALRAHR